MLMKRKDCEFFINTIDKIMNKKFNIQTQYKILKIKKAIEEELTLTQSLILEVCDEYWEKDENGEIQRNEDGGIKYKKGKMFDIQRKLNEIDNTEIQLPDIYFSLDELEKLELSLEELQVFMNFIK